MNELGLQTKFKEIGEIGSGGSVGVGICALLSGCEKYYALEIQESFDINQNLKILEEVVLLFKNRTSISDKYKKINLKVKDHSYPAGIIKPNFLQESIISEIKDDILNQFRNSKRIIVNKKWNSQLPVKLDFIFSRAVMEHVSNPGVVYKDINHNLKPGSVMFHDIEFHSHGITKRTDGHYLIPEYLWKVIYGKRRFFLNRWNKEEHENSIITNGFQIIETQETYLNHPYNREKSLYGATILALKHI